MARAVRAYVGLGANVGDPLANLRNAVRALSALPGVRVRGVARLYATTLPTKRIVHNESDTCVEA